MSSSGRDSLKRLSWLQKSTFLSLFSSLQECQEVFLELTLLKKGNDSPQPQLSSKSKKVLKKWPSEMEALNRKYEEYWHCWVQFKRSFLDHNSKTLGTKPLDDSKTDLFLEDDKDKRRRANILIPKSLLEHPLPFHSFSKVSLNLPEFRIPISELKNFRMAKKTKLSSDYKSS